LAKSILPERPANCRTEAGCDSGFRHAANPQAVGLNITEAGIDDPDPQFYENYVCGAQRNYTGYCNPEVDKLVDRQSMESNQQKRQRLVWEIERKLAEDDARPIIFYGRIGTCWQPRLKGLIVQVNSIYNGSRFEDIWLDR
jgi:peptide/nickel transport system substrate-binding protein